MKKILHLLVSGSTGGIEILMKNYASASLLDNVFLFGWAGGEIADSMRENGQKTIVLQKKKIGSLKLIKEIINRCQILKPDTVVVHHAAPLLRLVSVIIKNTFPKIRVINYAHSDAADMYEESNYVKQIISKHLQILAMKKSDKVIAISDSVKRSLIKEFGIDKDKIVVIYNGVPLDQFSPCLKDEHNEMRIIYVGRLIEGKGVQVIIEALSMISNLSYSFTVVGDGPYKSTLENLAKQYSIDNKVVFLGCRNDVPDLLKSSDVFVHVPILEEGFGITIVEAMASGNICICADSGGIPEIIHDKTNGFLVQKNNPSQLANVLEDLICEYPSSRIDIIEKNAIQSAKKYDLNKFKTLLDSVLVGDNEQHNNLI